MPIGRPRKPTATHILTGTFREDRHGGNEPSPLAGLPRCPRHLGKEAKQIWKELVRTMGATGVLTQADVFTMERFCTAVVRRRAAEAALDKLKMDLLVNDQIGAFAKRLGVIINNETRAQAVFGAALGLDPAARARLSIGSETVPSVRSRDRGSGPPPPGGREATA